MANEPKSEMARYAFGYSDKKPSKSYWVILAIMVLFSLSQMVSIGHG
jgi:hypothetical protein